MLDKLKEEAQRLGKPAWREMLVYVAELHGKSVHPPLGPLLYDWEEIGPGYCCGTAFGHWDIIHAGFDSLASEPLHLERQLLNTLSLQQEDGMLPSMLVAKDGGYRIQNKCSHPPVWVFAAEELLLATGTAALPGTFFAALKKQLQWFETARNSGDGGYFYLDITDRKWESGVDEGVRFDQAPDGARACVDATSHVYLLYATAAAWAERLGEPNAGFLRKRDELAAFIQNRLFCEETGFFHDLWAVDNPGLRVFAYEGMWPLVTGAATASQAERVIAENLLNERRFFTAHPLSTVAVCEEKFEARMWRGPAWNSMTFWAARGCLRYGRADAARALLERALDTSCAEFSRSSTIWEFYPPQGGNPLELRRKPHTPYNTPCRDYLGHNPLLAMARMYDGIISGRQ